MTKVILASNDYEVLNKVKSILGAFPDPLQLKTIKSEKELKKTTDLGIYILDFSIKEFRDSIKDLARFSEQSNAKILIIIDELDKDNEVFKPMKENILFKKFKLIDFTAKLSELINQKHINFFPIKIDYFLKENNILCDTYIKLGKNNFIKIANEYEDITSELIEHYKSKEMSEFYVSSSDFFAKCQSLFQNILPSIDHFPTKEEYIQKSYEALHQMVKDLGINEVVIEKVEESLKQVEETINSPQLKSIFELFKRSKGTFLYDHSYLTLIFSMIMCKHMNWENPQNRYKLSMACMLHDLAISDPADAMLENNSKVELMKLDKQKSQKILNHSEIMASLLEKDPQVPQEVINIVRKHHEGKGTEHSYQKGVTGVNLTQLECLFIITHAFVLELYSIAFNPNKFSTALENVLEQYQTGNFKPLKEALTKTVLEDIKVQF